MTRIARLRRELASDSTLLVTDLVNVRYLCGFTGSYGVLTIGPESAVLWTDSRYAIQAETETRDVDVRIVTNAVVAAANGAAGTTLVVESAHMTVATHEALGRPTGRVGLIESFRMVKDASEIATIKRACDISTQALAQAVGRLRLGLTERQFAVDLERTMVDLGAEAPAFDSIVAFGDNTAVPHHQPTERPLRRGDLIKIDFGARVDGYHSDCTRMFTAGPAADWQRDMHAEVLATQQLGVRAVRAGSALRDVDTLARGRLADVDGAFAHGLGHGVGLRIHEDPFFRPAVDGRLAVGMVVTVEPGVYVDRRGGVRIEDTLVVTSDGSHTLTGAPHDLIDIL